jgi:hypothetical protein
MKTRIILFILLIAISGISAFADCGRTTCTYITPGGMDLSATTSWQYTSNSLPDGTTQHRYDIYCTAGYTYYFSMCSTDGGAASYDSYLCLLGPGYGCGYPIVASNDDYCSVASYITYTPTTSSWYSVIVSGYTTNYGTYTLAYKYSMPEMIVPSTGNNTYTVCSGNIYDNGGSTGAYAASSNGYTILYPTISGNVIQLTGNYYTESGWDYVYIYNGVGTGGTLLFTGSTSALTSIGTITSTDATGALTILFTSDGSVQNSGFDFTIACVTSCITPGTPINLSSSVTGNSTSTISWSAGSPAGSPTVSYNWTLYTSTGTLVNSGNTSATSVSLSGLNCGASYYFTVYASTTCGSLNSSTATSGSFTTWAPGSYTLPFTDGFNPIKDCWTQQYVTGNSNVTVVNNSNYPTTTPQEGTSYLYWNSFSYSSGQETRFYTPPLTSMGVSEVMIRFFWMHDPGYVGYTDGVYIDWSTNGTTWTNATYVQRYDATLTGWNKKEILLPAGAGNQPTLYVCFRFYSNFGNNCSVDNLWIGARFSDPLPVTLLSFEGKCESGKVNLAWSTASEENNDHFIIHESSDLKNWNSVKIVTGAGNSNEILNYSTEFSGNGDMYYMLSQTDYDGKEVRFEPIFLSCSSLSSYIFVHPNPVINVLNIDTEVEVVYQLYNCEGQKILSGKEKTVNMEAFPSGLYVLEINDGNEKQFFKIIKK